MPGEHGADIAQSRRQGDPIGVRLRRGPCLRPDRTEERGVQRDGVAAGRVATGGGHERRDGGQGRRGGARIHRAVPPRHQMVEDQRSGGAGQRGEEPGARRLGVVLERASDPEDRVVRNAPRPGPHPRRSPTTRGDRSRSVATIATPTAAAYRAPGLRPACRAPRRSIPWTQATSDQTPPRRGAAVPAEVASRASQDSRHVSRRDRVGASSPEAERGLAETANEVPSATASAAAAPAPDSTEPSNSLAISSGSSRCQSAWATTGSQPGRPAEPPPGRPHRHLPPRPPADRRPPAGRARRPRARPPHRRPAVAR